MNVKWKKLLVVLLAATLLAVNIKSFADEAESRRFSILSVSGSEAFLTRGANEVKAVAGMPVGQGNSVRTGAKTKMYLETDDDKTIRLDGNSSAEVTKSSAKLLKITLKSGSLFFNVDKPLEGDEELSFDAAQTSMSIRGTSGILRISEEELVFHLIEGSVAWNIGGQIITVSPGQKVTLKAVPGQNIYQFQGVESFTWEDLPLFGLETVLEQRELLDMSAIGLNDAEQLAQAAAKAAQLQAQEAQESESQETQNPRIIRIDVPETRSRRNRGRGAAKNSSSTSPARTEPATRPTEEETAETTAEETVKPTEEPTTEAKTTESPTESGAEETSAEETSATEAPTTEAPTESSSKETPEESTTDSGSSDSSGDSSSSDSSGDSSSSDSTGGSSSDSSSSSGDGGNSSDNNSSSSSGTEPSIDELNGQRNVLIPTP